MLQRATGETMDSAHSKLRESFFEDSYGIDLQAAEDNAPREGNTLLMVTPGLVVVNDSSIPVHEKLSVDEMLRRWVGEFGWAQFLHFTLVSLAWAVHATHTMVMIFADREPQWRCTSSTQCTSGADKCSMADPSAWEWVGGKGSSIVSEWDLTCQNRYKLGLVDSMFFVGSICGSGIFGNLSDSSLGRKGALRIACLLTAIAGLATAFSPNYWIYLLLRWLTGLACGGVGLSSFVLSTEPVGPSKRGAVGMSTFYFFAVGIMALSPLAYFSSASWRHLYVFSSIPTFAYSAFVLPFLSESPRWYIVQSRKDDAMKTLRAFAKGNGKFIPSGIELASELGDDNNTSKGSATSGRRGQKASGNLLDVFRYAETRSRMTRMVVVWFTCALVYYGISLNVVNIGVSVYLSVFFNGIAEVPAYAITACLLGKLGRKAMLTGSMMLSGICCLIATFLITLPSLPDTSPIPNRWASPASIMNSDNLLTFNWSAFPFNAAISTLQLRSDSSTDFWKNSKELGRLICGIMGIFGMAAAYNLIYIYTTELFPTVVRNAALGLTTQAAQLGAIAAPLVVVLGRINPSISFAVFAVAAITGGVVSVKLPETLDKPMWDTLEGLKSEQLPNSKNHERVPADPSSDCMKE